MDSSDPVEGESARALAALHAAAARARRLLVVRGAVRAAAVLIGAMLAMLLLDWWLRPGPLTRALAALLALGWVAVTFWRHVAKPARTPLRPLDVAAVWDRVRGDGRHVLVQAVGTLAAPPPPDASPELSQRARAEAARALSAADPGSHLDERRGRRRMALLGLLLLLPLAGAVIAPDLAALWFRRWLLGSSEKWPQATWLEVAGLRGGNLVVAAHEPFTVEVSARAGSKVPDLVEITWELDGGDPRTEVMKRADSNRFASDLPPVHAGGRLWLRGGDDHSGPVPITPRERPKIRLFELRTRVPGEEAAATKSFETQDDDLRFLEGTQIELDVHAAEDAALLALAGGPDQPACEPTTLGPRAFRLAWSHDRAAAFTLEIESAETGLRSHARSLSIGVYRDTPPRVQLECPGIGERISPVARVPCRLEARDDLGITALRLETGVHAGGDESAPASRAVVAEVALAEQAGRAHVVAEQVVRVADLDVRPGSRVRITAVAADRRHPRPQEGSSRPRVLTVVPREVLLAEIILRLQASRARFRTALNDARAATDELAADLAPEAAAAFLKKWRVNERTLWSIRRAIEGSVKELSLNAVLEEQAIDILDKTVVTPFAELERGLMAEQRSQVEAAAPAGISGTTLAGVRERQTRIVGAMESILKGMDRWDSFVDLIAQLGEVIKLQTDARKDAQDAAERRREVPNGK